MVLQLRYLVVCRLNLHPEVVEAMRIAKEKEEEEERMAAEANGSVKDVKVDNVDNGDVEVDTPPQGFFGKVCQALRGFFAWKNLKK